MISSGRTEQGVWSRHERTLKFLFRLTDCQAQVARECVKGLRNAEIALRLGISVETVNKHLDLVYKKAEVHSRLELASKLLERAA